MIAFSRLVLINSFNILLKYGIDNPFVIESIFLSNSSVLLEKKDYFVFFDL